MMPERLAETDPFRQVPEMIGSGPFRFVADERVPGARNVYAQVRPLRAAAGRRAGLDLRPEGRAFRPRRVDDHAGQRAPATNALHRRRAGLAGIRLPRPAAAAAAVAQRAGARARPAGFVSMLRVNHLQPPFNNPAIRRALLGAIDQTAIMQAHRRPGRDQPLQRPARLLRPRHADGLRRRAGAADRRRATTPRCAPTCTPPATGTSRWC